jgi:alpha-amylase
VETVSQSEAGFERVYQSSMVMPLWRISLPPGRTWKAEIRLSID